MAIPVDLYLRKSDFRGDEDEFLPREQRLREKAAQLGWTVAKVIVENDLSPGGGGRSRPASAFKRVPVTDRHTGERVLDPDTGQPVLRVLRPGWQEIIADLKTGRARAVLAEDLDRVARDMWDGEDLIDAVAVRNATARSLSGSLTLTNGGTDSEVTMTRVMIAMANKSSRDTARRVAASRERLAAAGSYGGGKRPYGYRPDPAAPKYAKTLIIVEDEAAEIRAAAAAVLARAASPYDGESLKALVDGMRRRGLVTVSGKMWTTSTLRDALMKHAVAGVSVHTSWVADEDTGERRKVVTESPALWPAILPRDEWEAVRATLLDPGRRTTTARAPRWLLSGIARCGCGCELCQAGGRVTATGGGHKNMAYVCRVHGHFRRDAIGADEWVGAVIVRRLGQPDAGALLRPAAPAGTDTAALRAEAARLTAIGESQAGMHALGEISDAEFRAGSKARRARLDKITAELAVQHEGDQLAEFRGGRDPREVWESLSLARRRAVVGALVTVTFLPHGGGARKFNPGTVLVEPRQVTA